MYSHTQIGWVILAALAAPVLILVLTGAVLQGAWFPCAVLLAVLVLFSALTVEVDGQSVTAAFGPGVIRRRVLLEEIESCAIVRSPWWYGWGLRIIPGGMMFNVSGLHGVDLALKNGKHFRIGTDEPAQLLRAVRISLEGYRG